MFGYIEELEEEVFKELEDAEFVEIKKTKRFSSKEEEDAFVEDFLKRMDAIDAEYDAKANEDDNFEESHMCKVLKEWLNTSTFEDDIIEDIDDEIDDEIDESVLTFKIVGFKSQEEEDAWVDKVVKILEEDCERLESKILEEDDEEYIPTEFDKKLMEWLKTDDCFELEGSLIEHLEKEGL